MHLQPLAEELARRVAGEQRLERKAGEDRSGGQHADREQHPQRALMRGLVVLLIVRLAEEGLEDQAPGVERGQPGREDRHQEAIDTPTDCASRIGRFDDRVLGEIAGEAMGNPVNASVPMHITKKVKGILRHRPPMLRMSCS